MMRKAALSVALVAILVTVAVAANPVGRWGGTMAAGGTPLEAFYNFTVDGEVLNGTMQLPEHGAEFPLPARFD